MLVPHSATRLAAPVTLTLHRVEYGVSHHLTPSSSPVTVLYCTVLYCTVLYCTVLYCTVLYCTVLYCTVLYCTVLYCTVLYCTVLYLHYLLLLGLLSSPCKVSGISKYLQFRRFLGLFSEMVSQNQFLTSQHQLTHSNPLD